MTNRTRRWSAELERVATTGVALGGAAAAGRAGWLAGRPGRGRATPGVAGAAIGAGRQGVLRAIRFGGVRDVADHGGTGREEVLDDPRMGNGQDIVRRPWGRAAG